MKPWMPAAAIVVFALALLVALLARYEVTPAGESRGFLLDRWTGDVRFIYGPSSFPVVKKAAQ